MTLDTVMTRSVVSVDVDAELREIREIFEASQFHHVVVVSRGRLVGIISDRDLLKNISPFVGNTWMERKQDLNTLHRKAHQIMHRSLVVAEVEMSIAEATELMITENVTCLPVVSQQGRIRGIVTWRDLLRYHADRLAAESPDTEPADADDAEPADSDEVEDAKAA